MLTAQDILLQGAREEREQREGALIPVAVGSGMLGVAAGHRWCNGQSGASYALERRTEDTARGGRLAGLLL